MKRNPKIGVVVLIITGALLLGGGITWFMYHLQFINTAEVTSGTVVNLVHRGRGGFSPTVTFEDRNHTSYTFTSPSSQSPVLAEPGESVIVFYHADHPEQAILYSFVSLWFGPLMLYIAGSINILIGFIIWSVMRFRMYKNSSRKREL